MQIYYLFIKALEQAATAGEVKVLEVEANLDMGPNAWQPGLKGLQAMLKNPRPYLTGEKAIFEGENASAPLR